MSMQRILYISLSGKVNARTPFILDSCILRLLFVSILTWGFDFVNILWYDSD